MGPNASYTPPNLINAPPFLCFLADFLSKHHETLQITRRQVLSILKWLAKVRTLTNNCLRMKLGYDTWLCKILFFFMDYHLSLITISF